MSAKVSGDIGVRVGLGVFLLLLSGSQVFHFYEKTVNVVAHAFLMIASTGMIAVPSIDASKTISALEQQVTDLRNSIASQRPASMEVQRASMRPVVSDTSNQDSSRSLPSPASAVGTAKYESGESLFFNPYLSRDLNAKEITWCKQTAIAGPMNHKTATSCGYVKPSTRWCDTNRSRLSGNGLTVCK